MPKNKLINHIKTILKASQNMSLSTTPGIHVIATWTPRHSLLHLLLLFPLPSPNPPPPLSLPPSTLPSFSSFLDSPPGPDPTASSFPDKSVFVCGEELFAYVMHQKKSEVQIGKESSDVSSDFNPTFSSVYQKLQHQQEQHFQQQSEIKKDRPSNFAVSPQIITQVSHQNDPIVPPSSSSVSSPAPYKRPLLTQPHSRSMPKSPSLYHFSTTHPFNSQNTPSLFSFSVAARSAAYRIIRRFKHLCLLRAHIRLILLLSLPCFYFLVSHPSHSFLLDFLSAFAFSVDLLFSLNLASSSSFPDSPPGPGSELYQRRSGGGGAVSYSIPLSRILPPPFLEPPMRPLTICFSIFADEKRKSKIGEGKFRDFPQTCALV